QAAHRRVPPRGVSGVGRKSGLSVRHERGERRAPRNRRAAAAARHPGVPAAHLAAAWPIVSLPPVVLSLHGRVREAPWRLARKLSRRAAPPALPSFSSRRVISTSNTPRKHGLRVSSVHR